MKKTLLAVTLLACTTLPAMAESVDVSVVGTITPAACTPVLGGGGVIDYGVIPPASLSETDYTVLPERQIPISVTCDAPAKVALQAKSMRMGTTAGVTEGVTGSGASPVPIFSTANMHVVGLGLDGEAKIGGYGLRLVQGSATADNVAVDVIYQHTDMGDTWIKSTSGSMFNAAIQRNVSWATTGTLTPVAFEAMSGTIGVQAYINKASELDLSKPVALDGLTTIDLVYL